MIVVYSAKDFQSGLRIQIKVLRLNGDIQLSDYMTEIGSEGIYYYDLSNLPRGFDYVAVAIEPDGYKSVIAILRGG
jgi:enolase